MLNFVENLLSRFLPYQKNPENVLHASGWLYNYCIFIRFLTFCCGIIIFLTVYIKIMYKILGIFIIILYLCSNITILTFKCVKNLLKISKNLQKSPSLNINSC